MIGLVKICLHGPAEEKLLLIPDESVDLVITSPPYALQRKGVYDGIPAEEYSEWFLPIAREIHRVLKPTGSFFLNIKPHIEDGEVHWYVDNLVTNIRNQCHFKYIDQYAWVKQGYPGNLKGRFKNGWEPIYHFTKVSPDKIKFNPLACATPVKPESYKRYLRKQHDAPDNGSEMAPMNMSRIIKDTMARPSNVITAGVGNNQFSYQKYHPATFPEKLSDFFVLSFSDAGDTVLDPFAGSGTVGRSAWKHSRGFVLIEKKEEHYKRLEDWSNTLTLQSNAFPR